MGIHLPLGIKRGYHRHFELAGTVPMTRPVVDIDNGYCVTPMQQGIRLTTGAEFAERDAAPSPVQFDRLMPKAREVYPLGEQVDEETWLGKRPCFPDSRPVIGRRQNRRAVARLRPRTLGADTRADDRTPGGRPCYRRDTVLRSGAVRGGAVLHPAE